MSESESQKNTQAFFCKNTQAASALKNTMETLDPKNPKSLVHANGFSIVYDFNDNKIQTVLLEINFNPKCSHSIVFWKGLLR